MNKHIDKNRIRVPLKPQFAIVGRDHMPREVATEMLCAPLARTTNRERKTWKAARCTVIESTLRPIPEEQKTSVWLQSRNWLQLHQQLSRCQVGRAQAQRHFSFLTRCMTKLDDKSKDFPLREAILKRQMAVLDVHAAGLDALREAVENEIARRSEFCAKLHALAPSVAKKLRRELLGYARK